jgi:hypothetical protein
MSEVVASKYSFHPKTQWNIFQDYSRAVDFDRKPRSKPEKKIGK